jgi:2-methylcitrate dehydratase PrpD
MDAAVTQQLAGWLAQIRPARIPDGPAETARRLFLDVAGLCLAARPEPYVAATMATASDGPCTALGHARGLDAFSAALVNGTAAHGEDYDDTFEGGPVHCGAVIVPAVLAACEREQAGGDRALLGIVTGAELLCRLSLVAPKATHKAGFHPTAVFGAIAAAGAVGAALHLPEPALASAIGIAGSMASGIIEYLTDGAWTKRMHAGWAAQSGLRAALMARAGFVGPRTALEGTHGVYRAFAPSVQPDFQPLLENLGTRWVMETIAFKPYACGTMIHPFIDCAIRLAGVVRTDAVAAIECEVAEGTVHRLWEPLASKQRPPSAYAAKFSTPYCMAVAFIDGRAGFAQFTDDRVSDAAVLALASKIGYVINPGDEYPRNYTGHLRATLTDGSTQEFRQPHLRGGVRDPLSLGELEGKFADNVRQGGGSGALAERVTRISRELFTAPRLDALREVRP